MENFSTFEKQPQPVNLATTHPIKTPSGNNVWVKGYILRENYSSDPNSPNTVVPIEVFLDPTTGQILDSLLPEALKSEYSPTTTWENNSPSQQQPPQENNGWGQQQPPQENNGWEQQPPQENNGWGQQQPQQQTINWE